MIVGGHGSDQRQAPTDGGGEIVRLLLSILCVCALLGCTSADPSKTPTQIAAGWAVGTPQSQGIAPAAVDRLVSALRALDYVDAVVVARNDTLIAEAYENGYDAGQDHQLASVSKAVLSALVGIAVQQGYVRGLDQPLAQLLPDHFAPIDDAGKRRITVRDLLTMRQGLASTDTDLMYFVWRSQSDRAAFSLARPMTHPPGSVFEYNTGNAHLLSVALTHVTGQATRAFAEQHLFGPGGITIGRWGRDGAGYDLGGEDMFMSARNLARFAALYANGGRYRDRQIIPAAWVQESTRGHAIPVPDDVFNGFEYGYYWWHRIVAGHKVTVARGWGGQTIYVVPAVKLVIVVFGNWWVLTDQADRQGREIRAGIELFLSDVLPGLARG